MAQARFSGTAVPVPETSLNALVLADCFLEDSDSSLSSRNWFFSGQIVAARARHESLTR
jgi:hypothetical protein